MFTGMIASQIIFCKLNSFIKKSVARSLAPPFRKKSRSAHRSAMATSQVAIAHHGSCCRYQLFASYDGSAPTSKKPKKSFSCGSHTTAVSLSLTAVFLFWVLCPCLRCIFFCNVNPHENTIKSTLTRIKFTWCFYFYRPNIHANLPVHDF